MAAALPQSPLRWILRCLFALCLSSPITSAIAPVRWDYPLIPELARFHGFDLIHSGGGSACSVHNRRAGESCRRGSLSTIIKLSAARVATPPLPARRRGVFGGLGTVIAPLKGVLPSLLTPPLMLAIMKVNCYYIFKRYQ